jgi:hypothetical protein
MTFSWSPSVPSQAGGQAPRILHILYEYDGPKLVLAVDDREWQVLGVAVDEAFEERITRWVFAPAPPAKIVALLEGATFLRDLFTQGEVQVVDLAASGDAIQTWGLDGASLPDALLPEPDAGLPELTPPAHASLLAEQRRLANEEQRLARAKLLFDGRPVMGRRGISADFAAGALGRYQDLVSTAYASRRRGSLGSKGRIPDRAVSTLYLVDMPRGSVGFALQEITEQPLLVESELAGVVSDVGALIEAAAAGDQELVETVADFDPRVITTLNELFSLVHKAEATFRLVSNDRTYTFDAERIRMAVERTATQPEVAPDLPFVGALRGYLPGARQFEFWDASSGAVIKGRIAGGADLDALRGWLDKPGVARMRVVTVTRGAGKSHAFTLLAIEPPEEVPAPPSPAPESPGGPS